MKTKEGRGWYLLFETLPPSGKDTVDIKRFLKHTGFLKNILLETLTRQNLIVSSC